jgi:hypothetical protein
MDCARCLVLCEKVRLTMHIQSFVTERHQAAQCRAASVFDRSTTQPCPQGDLAVDSHRAAPDRRSKRLSCRRYGQNHHCARWDLFAQ